MNMELKLGSIPLVIHGRFLLLALLLGLNERDLGRLAIWLVIVLVSVVIHELGHALVGKAFGLRPRIELHGMGGVTMFDGGRAEMSTAKSIAISVAGPFAGFLFAALIYGSQVAGFHPAHPLAAYAVRLLFFCNIFWGVLNLLPILPLDGGTVFRSVATAISKPHGEKIARVVSVAIAIAFALWAIRGKQWLALYLGVLFAFQNVQALRHAGELQVDQVLADVIRKAQAALDRDAPSEALAVLRPALAMGGSVEIRQVALRVYVVALVRDGRWREVMDVIERERAVIGPEDLGRYAEGMRELGRREEAERIDELVRAPGALSAFRA